MTLSTKRPSSGAHPRSRGENSSRSGPGAIGRGSSPLTRGKPSSARNATQPCGLIPAHAGKTGPVTINALSARAHPRSRGENGTRHDQRTFRAGSSPLTRGKRTRAACPPTATGLIPAHAGKTNYPCCAQLQHRAHPRSRGENVVGSIARDAPAGSSPLTRGKHRACRWRRENLGLIPAHAGKTKGAAQLLVSRRAHPRSRGENPRTSRAWSLKRGSSPLTRGKRFNP